MNFEQITLGQIALAVTFIAGLIGGIGVLHKSLKGWISKSLKEQFDTINNNIERLQARLDEVDMEATKNFLVARLSEIDKGKQLDGIVMERLWEELEHYEKQGGNSYIHRKVEQLKADGKL